MKNKKTLRFMLDIGKYKKTLLLAVVVVLVVSLLDIWSAHSGIFGSVLDYTLGNFGVVNWWQLFFKFVLIIFLIPAVLYYLLINRDFSESVGIFGFSIILYFGGLADLFYFIFQKIPIPETLGWLENSPFINFISTTLLGYSTVTNISLLVSVILSFVIAWIFAKMMKEKF